MSALLTTAFLTRVAGALATALVLAGAAVLAGPSWTAGTRRR